MWLWTPRLTCGLPDAVASVIGLGFSFEVANFGERLRLVGALGSHLDPHIPELVAVGVQLPAGRAIGAPANRNRILATRLSQVFVIKPLLRPRLR
jgi:hypothetical protein